MYCTRPQPFCNWDCFSYQKSRIQPLTYFELWYLPPSSPRDSKFRVLSQTAGTERPKLCARHNYSITNILLPFYNVTKHSYVWTPQRKLKSLKCDCRNFCICSSTFYPIVEVLCRIVSFLCIFHFFLGADPLKVKQANGVNTKPVMSQKPTPPLTPPPLPFNYIMWV